MDEPQNPPPADAPSEEELRAAYEEQLRNIRVEDVLIQTVVSLINLAGRKAGLGGGPEAEAEKDLEQVRQAIEGTRALLPLVEVTLGPDAAQIKAALSQLQMAYAREAGPGGPPPEAPEPPPATPPPSRLWVPGQ
jgi:hypothetical protein